MSEPILIALFVLLGGALTALVGYLISRRTNSGTVETSAAVELWREGAAQREYLTVQVVGLREQLIKSLAEATAASSRIGELLARVDTEQRATATAREETRLSRAETADLKRAVAEVHREVTTGNAQSLAMLADNAESRRISIIPEADRTPTEQSHLNSVGNNVGISEGSPR